MADYAVNIILRAKDEASPVIRNLVRESRRVRSVRGGIGGGFDPASMVLGGGGGRGGRRRGGPWEHFDFDSAHVASRLAGASANLSRLTTMTRGALMAPLDLAMGFEQSMAEVRAVTGDAQIGDNFEKLTAKARELGASTEFTASEAASALKYMGIAGLTTQEQLDTLAPLLDAATVSGEKLGRTSDIVTDVMAGFSLESKQATSAVDSMIATITNSNTNLGQLYESLKKVGPLATKVGVDLNEVNTMVGTLANVGLKGSEAGTALRNILLSLTGKPSKDMRKLLRHLGLDSKALRKELEENGLKGAMTKLMDQIQHMSPAMQLFASNTLFGRRTAVSATAVMQALASDGYEELEKKIESSSGAAEKAAAGFRSTSKAGVKELISALEDLGIEVGNTLLPVMDPMVDKAREMAGEFKDWAAENPELVKQLGESAAQLVIFGSALAPVLLAASTLTSVVTLGGFAFKAFTGGVIPAAGAIGKFGKAVMGAGPNVATLIGNRAGMLGILGAVAAAGMLGYEIGVWADENWGLSDSLAGVNKMLDTQIDLQMGLARVRGAALLGDLTEDERLQLEAAQRKRDQLFEERQEVSTFKEIMLGDDSSLFGLSIGDGRGSKQIEEDIAKQDAIIDRINETGIRRGRSNRGEVEAAEPIRQFEAVTDTLKALRDLGDQLQAAAEVHILVSDDRVRVNKKVKKGRASVTAEQLIDSGYRPAGG